jgi:transcriptional regulator with XRE-family HTH domain
VSAARKPRATAIDADLSALLVHQRVAARLTQTELAQRIGVTPQQVCKYERAVTRLSVSRLVAIAAALGCDPAALFPPPAWLPVEYAA